jgi:hypothetical protein
VIRSVLRISRVISDHHQDIATDTDWRPGAMQIELKEIRKYFGNVKDRLIEDFNQQTGLIGQV